MFVKLTCQLAAITNIFHLALTSSVCLQVQPVAPPAPVHACRSGLHGWHHVHRLLSQHWDLQLPQTAVRYSILKSTTVLVLDFVPLVLKKLNKHNNWPVQLFVCNCHMGQQDEGFIPSICEQNSRRNHHPLDLHGFSAPFSLTIMSLRSINYDLIHDHLPLNKHLSIPLPPCIIPSSSVSSVNSHLPSPPPSRLWASRSLFFSLPVGKRSDRNLSLQTQLSWRFNVHYWAAKAVGVS